MTKINKFNVESEVSSVGPIKTNKTKFYFESEVSSVGLIIDK